MAEHINATTLLKEIDHAFHTDIIGKKDVINLIINLPAADVVEVVRCRECKYHEDTSITEHEHCCLIGKTVCYNDFCSYGKWKGGDGNVKA